MGGERQEAISKMFQLPEMAIHFEAPVFSPGVPSRDLRTRSKLIRYLRKADLISEEEFTLLDRQEKESLRPEKSETFFDCLKDLPISPRRGRKCDQEIHYSNEFWLKAKGINRGRAVLGCVLAHLIALKTLVTEDFDVLLEDNVRLSPSAAAHNIREFLTEQKGECHFRYYGWLGSVPNINWIYSNHERLVQLNKRVAIMSAPLGEDIERSLDNLHVKTETTKYVTDELDPNFLEKRRPGGTSPVWGCYAYWISKAAFEDVIVRLRSDVGALLWKSKRARHYTVKPIDKILPRIVKESFGQQSIQLSTHPSFFRAPMLTSRIHTQFDPLFCKSTSIQLAYAEMTWSDLWLTEEERLVVDHYNEATEWLTPSQLRN